MRNQRGEKTEFVRIERPKKIIEKSKKKKKKKNYLCSTEREKEKV